MRLMQKTFLFQYVPFMYNRRGGINFSLPLFFLYLRLFTDFRIQIMFHEVNYPFLAQFKAIVLYISHKLMGFWLGILANDVFASTNTFRDMLARMLLEKKVHVLPVGSNINPSNASNDRIDELRKELAPKNELLIGMFGTFHPSKNVKLPIEKLVGLSKKLKRKLKIIYIGTTLEELASELGVDEILLKDHVFATGFLPQDKVAEYLKCLDGFIAYFIDGVSTRRGSLLAAIQEGIPVITTEDKDTDIIFKHHEFIKLLPVDSKKFSVGLVDLVVNGWPIGIKASHGSQEKKFYQSQFSWSLQTEIFLSVISGK